MAVALFLVPMADNVASRATTSACETFHLIRPIVTRPPGGGNRESYQNFRAKINFMLSDDFDILLSGAYFHRNDDSFEAYTYADEFGSTPVFSAMGARVTILSQDVYQSYEPQNRTNVYSASARVRLGIGSGDLISISAYQNAKTYLMPDFVSADTPIFNFAANDTGRSFSQEVYYRGNVGRLGALP